LLSASYIRNMHTAQDVDIIQSVLQGNKAAYAVLVERYQTYVYTIINRLIPVREEAEDVSQEVFVKAYLSLAGFKGTSKFSTWLYTIAHTTAISHLRRSRPDVVFAEESTIANIADRQPEYLQPNHSLRTAVNSCIKQLPPDDAEIITLFYLAEQSIEEIGMIMKMEPNTAKVKLHRARQKLKDIVERTYGKEKALLYRN
jgi:RNA polymerase sigma factor (sigma-70 family)